MIVTLWQLADKVKSWLHNQFVFNYQKYQLSKYHFKIYNEWNYLDFKKELCYYFVEDIDSITQGNGCKMVVMVVTVAKYLYVWICSLSLSPFICSFFDSLPNGRCYCLMTCI